MKSSLGVKGNNECEGNVAIRIGVATSTTAPDTSWTFWLVNNGSPGENVV